MSEESETLILLPKKWPRYFRVVFLFAVAGYLIVVAPFQTWLLSGFILILAGFSLSQILPGRGIIIIQPDGLAYSYWTSQRHFYPWHAIDRFEYKWINTGQRGMGFYLIRFMLKDTQQKPKIMTMLDYKEYTGPQLVELLNRKVAQQSVTSQ